MLSPQLYARNSTVKQTLSKREISKMAQLSLFNFVSPLFHAPVIVFIISFSFFGGTLLAVRYMHFLQQGG